ncbi:MAG: hypothetical protein OES26_13685 [Gammaproteobacteria bacterium]|nr:hypothetical protein [Gammaproteobacteria bacterium]
MQRLGSMFQTRISFVRTLVRRMRREAWRCRRVVWDIDDAWRGVRAQRAHKSAAV